jgi:hypothetical protein
MRHEKEEFPQLPMMYILKREGGRRNCGLCMLGRLLILPATSRIRSYNITPLKRHRFKRHLVYNVRCSTVLINSSRLTITLYSSVRATHVYNDTKSFHDAITKFDFILF